MKKVLLTMSILLLTGMFCACSKSDDLTGVVDGQSSIDSNENEEKNGEQEVCLQPGDMVCVYNNVNGVYEPISCQEAPEWIKPILEEYKAICNVYLFQGERNGSTIFFLHTDLDSSIGTFFDKDGERLLIETDYDTFFSETNNWKLIIYYDETSRGDVLKPVKEIKGYDTISDFFNSELPIDVHSAGFFVNHDKDECYVINTLEGLKSIYSGGNQIPKIDFEKYTLIIGQHIMPASGYIIEKQEMVLRDNIPVLNLIVNNKYEYKPTLYTPLYFWGVYPKLYKSNVDVNIIIL